MDSSLRINAGKFRDEVSFYTITATRDDAGGFNTPTKTLLFSNLCYVENMPTNRVFQTAKNDYTESINLVMRYETNKIPNESMQAYFNNKYYNIVSVENVEHRNLVFKIILARK